MASAHSEEDAPKLSSIFDDLWTLFSFLETTNESSSSIDIQKKLIRGIESGEKAILLVNELELFSDNEEIEEVASNELRYILLPALLGYFTGQKTLGDRLDNVKKSQVFYIDYLRLCKNYGLTNVNIPKVAGLEPEETEETENDKQVVPASASGGPPTAASMRCMAGQRGNKIERFKQQKEYAARLKQLYDHVQQEHVDDEVKREYYTTLLKKWVNTALDELTSIESELQILEHMAKMRIENSLAASAVPPPPPKKAADPSQSMFRPFILTKNDLQKKVFGAGYPSMPTYSIEEFYEQRVADGRFPGPGCGRSAAQEQGSLMDKARMTSEEQVRQQDEAGREEDAKVERDDPADLQRARNWDDWKDDHRTGWGNTQNKG